MSEVEESGTKVHYVCQTYIAKTTARGQQGNLQIDKQLQYSTPHEAQERAEREFRAENCVGADAYMVIEDSRFRRSRRPDIFSETWVCS